MENNLPKPCRLKWLTTARHISRYYKLKDLVVTDIYRLILEENEEYWRHRFYILLDQIALRSSGYYMDLENNDWSENIEPKSAMVINDFSNWQDSTKDPLDSINEGDLIKTGKPFYGHCGSGIESYSCILKK